MDGPEEFKFRVDPELRDFMPPCSTDSDRELEDSIKTTGGPVDPITVWEEKKVIVDGHRRYRIAKKHGLPVRVRYMSFPNISSAKSWMARWALARRNLNTKQRNLLIEQMAESISSAEGVSIDDAREKVRKEHDIPRSNIQRAKLFTKTVRKLDPGVQETLVKSSINAPIATINRLASLPVKEQKEVMHEAIVDGDRTLSKKVDGLRKDWSAVDKEIATKGAARPKTGKPDMRILRDSHRQLGRLISAIKELNRRVPNPSGMTAAKRNLDGIGLILESWRLT
jgi:hypothetical protein